MIIKYIYNNYMYRYLFFILFGIIIFLLYNRKETLNIGEECETDPDCNDGSGYGPSQCGLGHCKCLDELETDKKICIEIDYVLEDKLRSCATGEDEKPMVIMFANTTNNPRESGVLPKDFIPKNNPDKGCVENASDTRRDLLYELCGDDTCKDNHMSRYFYTQQCPLEISYDNPITKNLQNSGFEYLRALTSEHHEKFKSVIKTLRNKYREFGYVEIRIPEINMTYQEYLMKEFLERQTGYNVKTIKLGIMYVNGQIFYFTYQYMNFRFNMEMANEDDKERMVREYAAFELTQYVGGQSIFPKLHIDFTNFIRYSELYDDFDGSYDDKTGMDLANNPFFDIEQYDLTELNDLKNQENTQYLNFWVMIENSEVSNSLGIVDIIPDELPSPESFYQKQKVDEILTEITKDKGRATHHKKNTKVNVFSTGAIINLNNYNPELSPELRKAYTYNMKPSDVLVFDTTLAPHFGIQQEEGDWRISGESRYALYGLPFDIMNVFYMYGSKGEEQIDFTNPRIWHTWPNTEPPHYYYLNEILQYFKEQFIRIRDLYEQLNEFVGRPFSLELFKRVMDGVPYFDYLVDGGNLFEHLLRIFNE